MLTQGFTNWSKRDFLAFIKVGFLTYKEEIIMTMFKREARNSVAAILNKSPPRWRAKQRMKLLSIMR